MRDLKLRGYWKDRQPQLGMCEVMAMNFETDQMSMRNGAVRVFPKISEVEVMQYTGLLDKNGKEIYEGDICSFNLAHHTHGSHHNDVKRGIIKWDDEDTGFYLETENGHIPYVKTYHALKLEVIGNIHQNPELLKGK